jgi:PKD domain
MFIRTSEVPDLKSGPRAVVSLYLALALLVLLSVPASTLGDSATRVAVPRSEPFTVSASAGGVTFPNGCGSLPAVQQFNSVVFDGTPPYAYSWSFGDGTPNSTLVKPSHQYERFGQYAVRLVATDANASRAYSNLTVGEEPPPCGPPYMGSYSSPDHLLEIIVPVALAPAVVAYVAYRFRRTSPPPPIY